MKKMKVLLYYAFLAASVGISSSSKISCSISASPVREGHPVSITCTFPEDLSEQRKDFYVYRTDLEDNSERKTVLSCQWSGNSTEPDCTLLRGYQMQRSNTEVRILITRVHKSQEGRYSCQIVGLEPKDISGCELKVEVAAFETSCDAPSVSKGKPGAVTCHFNKDLQLARKELLVTRRPFLTTGDSNETPVWDCYWRNDILECKTEAGNVTQIPEVSSSLTLNMTVTSEKQEGSYLCKVHDSLPPVEKSCDFRLKDISSVASDSGDFKKLEIAHLSVACGIFVAIVVLIVLGVIIIFRCRNKKTGNNQQSTEEMPLKKRGATAESNL